MPVARLAAAQAALEEEAAKKAKKNSVVFGLWPNHRAVADVGGHCFVHAQINS